MSVRNIEAIYPLTPLQQGLMFHSLYSPGGGTYVDQMSCQIRGELHVEVFRRSWQTVVDRHSILRTSFLWEQLEEPLQIVHGSLEIPLREYDWRSLTTSEQSAVLNRFLKEDRATGFEFSRAPLMRLTLLRTGRDTYYFVLSSHHILLDGWSSHRLISELVTFYEMYRSRRSIEVKRPRPYRDYVDWLRRQDIRQAEIFWREELKGFKNPTPLWEDRQPSQQADRNQVSVELSPASTNRVEALAKRLRISVNTIIQGVWSLVLSRHSGESDVVFGIVTSGRSAPLPGVESMVGLLINTLPLRVRLDEEDSVKSFLRGLQARQMRALAYEYSPLVQVQTWSELPRGMPLFESLLVFQNYPVDGSTGNRVRSLLQLSQVRNFEKVNYPLMIVAGHRGALYLKIDYDASRFDPSTASRLLEHMRLVLESIVANCDQRIGKVTSLTAVERNQAITEWNDMEHAWS